MAKRNYEIDKIALREAILMIENDSIAYEKLMSIYLPNLQKKLLSGKYDRAKAVKLMEYYYTNYCVPRLVKEYQWNPKFNPAERMAFANHFLTYLEDEFLKPMERKNPSNLLNERKK